MGGRLALTFAILYPDKIRKLILESTSPGLLTEEERNQRCMKDGELAHFIKENGMRRLLIIGKKSLCFQQWKIFHQRLKNRLDSNAYPIQLRG